MKRIFLCTRSSFQRWRISTKIHLVILAAGVFAWWILGDVSRYCGYLNIKAAPWILPHYLQMPLLQVLFGIFTTVLYSDAPFIDEAAQFLLIRTGKRVYFIGQLLYLLLSSFIWSIYWFLITLLPFWNKLEFNPTWGDFLTLMSTQSGTSNAGAYGLSLSFYCEPRLNKILPGWQATLIAWFLLWMCAFFIGVLVFTLNLISKANAGILAAGLVFHKRDLYG